MKFCPQCGTAFEASAKFCLECGFDRSSIITAERVIESIPGLTVKDASTTPQTPIEITISHAEAKQVCPKCHRNNNENHRFCQDCGFDSHDKFLSDSKPEPEIVRSVVETTLKSKPAVIQHTRVTNRNLSSVYTRNERSGKSEQQRGKKTILWIMVIIIGLGVLGTAGWFGYNSYRASPGGRTDDTVIKMGISEYTDSERGVAENVVKEQPEDKTTTPMSRIDKELAKQKAKRQDPSVQQKSSDQIDIGSQEFDIVPKVLLEVGRKEDPKNKNPKDPTKLTLRKPTMIVRIITDHYNDGMGTPRGGFITIKDEEGNTVGSYKALGITGKNGTPSGRWVAEPNKILKKGTYFISDSDEATWSKTLVGGTGFVVVEGYLVE